MTKEVIKCPVCGKKLYRNATNCQGQTDYYHIDGQGSCEAFVMVYDKNFCDYCGKSHKPRCPEATQHGKPLCHEPINNNEEDS